MRETIKRLWPEIDWIANLQLREQVTQTWIKALERSPLKADDLNQIPFTLLVPNCPITFMEHKRCVVHIARDSAQAMHVFMGRALPLDVSAESAVKPCAILSPVSRSPWNAAFPTRSATSSLPTPQKAIWSSAPPKLSSCITPTSWRSCPSRTRRTSKSKHKGECPVSSPKPISPPPENVTAKMSRWAAALQYKDLSPEAVYQAKRFLLDSFGCALGGYRQHDVAIALDVLDEIAGRGLSTVIGTGRRVDPVSASLANALMIRCMDYNDIYWKQDPSHPSDIFPAAIACCERAYSGGKELIVGLVLGHEFEMRFCEAAFPGVRERGWHHATLTAFVSPIVAGRALHLPAEQIQHAIGISASRQCTLGAVTAGKLTMMKNTVDPMATQSGVLAALLAEKG